MWARVCATYLYPVKACAPQRVASLAFTPAGEISGDREWVVVDADDRITWSGAIPALARVLPHGWPDRPAIASDAGDIVPLPPPSHGAPRTIHSWNSQRQAFDALEGRDAGDAVAAFASAIAGQRIRLVHLSTTAHRPNPVHVVTDASLRVLAAALERDSDLLRFRPNVVLSGDGDALPPFVEEQATALRCEPAHARLELHVTGPCERCVVINVDPASGALDADYLKTVVAQSRTRRAATAPLFGVYARAAGAGALATGDRVEIVIPEG